MDNQIILNSPLDIEQYRSKKIDGSFGFEAALFTFDNSIVVNFPWGREYQSIQVTGSIIFNYQANPSGFIEASENIIGFDTIWASKYIKAGGYIKTFTNSRWGYHLSYIDTPRYIEAGRFIESDWYLRAWNGPIKAKNYIRAHGRIETGGTIETEGLIECYDTIKWGKGLKTHTNTRLGPGMEGEEGEYDDDGPSIVIEL